MTREEAIKTIRLTCPKINDSECDFETAMRFLIPELAESEDERIRKALIKGLKFLTTSERIFTFGDIPIEDIVAYLEKQKEYVSEDFEIIWETEDCKTLLDEGEKLSPRFKEMFKEVCHSWYDKGIEVGVKQKEQKPVEIEVYEVGKGTTIYGQDYKCKKDYKEGNCWFIKDVIYHCSMDGYLTDQNGISWCCTPEWFKEYIQSNTEWAEEEKTRFVSGQFLQCKLSFDEFKEGEHYWLEYVGDDTYVGRSDNILNLRFHITPRQLYTLFSQQIEEKQKEQRLWEWSDTNELVFNDICKHLENEGYSGWVVLLNALRNGEFQFKQEWSEEDRRIMDGIQLVLESWDRTHSSIAGLPSLIPSYISWLKARRPQSKQKRQIKEGDKVSIHCRKDRKEGIIAIYDGKVGEVIHVWDAKRNPWGHIGVRLDNGCNDGFYEDELEVLDEPHWKPSEEQMTNLLRAEGRLRIEGESVLASKLAELYEQLKKLM